MFGERVEGFGHVAVAHVPGRDPTPEHGAVVEFGVLHRHGIPPGTEQFIGLRAVAAETFQGRGVHLDQLGDDLLFAGLSCTERSRVPVCLSIRSRGVIEACVSRASTPGRLAIDSVQVGDHILHRAVQTVEVEPVETDAVQILCSARVVSMQPVDEVLDHGISPHPRREPFEPRQRLVGGSVTSRPLDPAIDSVGVGPVGLRSHSREAFVLDEPPGDSSAGVIELFGAVRALADEYEFRVADEVVQHCIRRDTVSALDRRSRDDFRQGLFVWKF